VSEAFDLGPLPQRVPVDARLAASLVAEQFPQWSDRPVRPVADNGWDNHTFRLGPDLSIRMPSAREYATAVDKEHQWLPRLAPQLPLPIPVPIARGRPGHGYPFAWSVLRWVEGGSLVTTTVEDRRQFAVDLAGFLTALQSVDPEGAPGPGVHNWFRGGPLGTFDGMVADALRSLRGHIDIDLVRAMWTEALVSAWDGIPVWFHGRGDSGRSSTSVPAASGIPRATSQPRGRSSTPRADRTSATTCRSTTVRGRAVAGGPCGRR
jgi:aminoglycoside phosphotransferase (APT) family kinase protein